MIYIKLFINFLYVGLFSFGGSVSAIPLVREVSLKNNWLTAEELENIIAISESTPGGLIANLATYVGTLKAGLLGGIVATFSAILPAFIIILILYLFFNQLIEKKKVQFVFSILRICVIGIIFGIGCYLLINNIGIIENNSIYFNKQAIAKIFILLLILFIMLLYKKMFNKSITSIVLIFIGAILGIIFN